MRESLVSATGAGGRLLAELTRELECKYQQYAMETTPYGDRMCISGTHTWLDVTRTSVALP